MSSRTFVPREFTPSPEPQSRADDAPDTFTEIEKEEVPVEELVAEAQENSGDGDKSQGKNGGKKKSGSGKKKR